MVVQAFLDRPYWRSICNFSVLTDRTKLLCNTGIFHCWVVSLNIASPNGTDGAHGDLGTGL